MIAMAQLTTVTRRVLETQSKCVVVRRPSLCILLVSVFLHSPSINFCLFINQSINNQSISLPTYLYIYLFVCRSIYLSIYLSICQSIYPFVYLAVCLTIYVYLFLNLYVYLSLHPTVYLSLHPSTSIYILI